MTSTVRFEANYKMTVKVPTGQNILATVQKEPDLTDSEIGTRMNLSCGQSIRDIER
jgi:hypothetical protein